MIISHEHKFIFLKTRKTAGTSMEIALSRFCGPKDMITNISSTDEITRRKVGGRGPQNNRTLFWLKARKHGVAQEARRVAGERAWRDYFKFTIERNPFDKAISRYWWELRRLGSRPTMSEFLAGCRPILLSNWPIYTIDDEVVVDHVVRYEDLAAETAALSDRLGFEVVLPLSKGTHRTDRRHYSQVLSQADRQVIERICAKELAAFGYEWVDAPATTMPEARASG